MSKRKDPWLSSCRSIHFSTCHICRCAQTPSRLVMGVLTSYQVSSRTKPGLSKMSLSRLAPESSDAILELKRQLLSKSFTVETSPANFVNNFNIESIMKAIIVFYQAQIEEGILPSTILFKNDALKLASWIRYHAAIAKYQNKALSESLLQDMHSLLYKLLLSWREEILRASIPRPRDIFDFKVFQRTGCVWDEWLEIYRQISFYPELYPVFVGMIR